LNSPLQKIESLLRKVNSNKACGPDAIHGKILKNCAVSLSTPLSLLLGLDNAKSSSKPVLSGFPQGSILGKIFIVLFINGLPACLSQGTNIALYADDTKIWRPIYSDSDHDILQKDIDNLND
jgi:hypothetical protein